ncbi:MAG: magnesium transporter [Desulfovibrionales bacterium]
MKKDEKNSDIQNGGEVSWPSATMENIHPADAADHLEQLPVEEQVRVLKTYAIDDAAETITEMERHDRVELMTHLPPEASADILEVMSPDDAADILIELNDAVRANILRYIEAEDAEVIADLLKFDPETAGGVMNTEVLVLDQNLTADEAISLIRGEVEHFEIPYYAYIVDDKRHLLGVISLRELILSRPGKVVRDFLQDQNLIYVTYEVDKEVVAKLISRYNFLALPVVDHEQRILGVVTVDDVIDIIHEEASEDMQSMVGAGSDETVDSPWTYSLKKRTPWLIINLLNSAVSAWVVAMFEGTIAQMAILAALMPVVANQAGNTGHQALAVMIRQMAMERFDRKKMWFAVLREAKIGLVTGLIISLLVFVAFMIITANAALSGVLALAMGADMLLGAVLGASIPLLLKAMGRDPAQASSIFLTSITDAAGFFILLGTAGLVLL